MLATRKKVPGAIVLAAFASAMPTALYACQCGHKVSAAESLADSTRVFEGEALWIEPAWATLPDMDHGFPLRRWRFRILKVWKGSLSNKAVVVDARGNCSYAFQAGKTYLVFGRPHPTISDNLHTTICTATREIPQADVPELGQATTVGTPRPLGPEPIPRRARRILMTSWYTGLTFVSYRWRELKESSPAGTLLLSYVAVLAAALFIALGFRSSIRGHFKRIALVVGMVSVLAAAALLILGGWHASRTPYLHELVRLGG